MPPGVEQIVAEVYRRSERAGRRASQSALRSYTYTTDTLGIEEASYVRHVPWFPASGCVAMFSCDTVSGARLASDAGNVYGTITGATHSPAGRRVYGLDLDGVDDDVSCSNTADLRPASAVSITCWVKAAERSVSWPLAVEYEYNVSWGSYALGLGGAVGSGEAGLPVFIIRTSASNVRGTDIQVAIGTSRVDDNTWHHLTGVYDGATMTLYVDNVQVDSRAWTGSIVYDSSKVLNLGKAVAGTRYAGILDEVYIYNRALASTEIAAIYKLQQNPSLERLFTIPIAQVEMVPV